MQIFFCSHCGQRFTDQDLSEDQRENQDFTKVLCSKCVTAPMRAISGVPMAANVTTARLVSRGKLATVPGARPVSGSASAIPVPQRTSGKLGAARGMREGQPEPVAEASGSEKKWIFIGAGGAGVLVLIVVVVLMSGGKKEKPPPVAEVKPQPKSMILDEKPLTISTDPSTRTPGPTSGTTPTPEVKQAEPDTRTLEQRADTDFDKLRKELTALPKEDNEGRIKLCQEFLDKYGSTLLGARVRSMQASYKGSSGTPTPAPVTSASEVPLKANEEVLAKASVNDFSGGEYYKDFAKKGVDSRAIWGIKTPNYRMQTTIKVENAASEANLMLRTLRHDLPTPPSIRIELNDQVIYNGRDKNTQQAWQYSTYPIPAGVLKSGDNLLKIVCTEDSDKFHASPWFMINAAAIVAKK